MPDNRDNSAITSDYRRWRRLRKMLLSEEPLCRMCQGLGKATLATVVDHIISRRDGGTDDRGNLQPLCAPCHNGPKASFERTGKLRGCDVNGVPLDPGHPWR